MQMLQHYIFLDFLELGLLLTKWPPCINADISSNFSDSFPTIWLVYQKVTFRCHSFKYIVLGAPEQKHIRKADINQIVIQFCMKSSMKWRFYVTCYRYHHKQMTETVCWRSDIHKKRSKCQALSLVKKISLKIN